MPSFFNASFSNGLGLDTFDINPCPAWEILRFSEGRNLTRKFKFGDGIILWIIFSTSKYIQSPNFGIIMPCGNFKIPGR